LRDFQRNRKERSKERREEIFTAVKMCIVDFLVAIPCGLVSNYHLRGMYHPEDGGDTFS
jgi:hypothetical protein